MKLKIIKYSGYFKAGFVTVSALIMILIFLISVPRTLFNDPFSTVLISREGNLLGARIARDGQWRFPPTDSIPVKYLKCLLNYEDRYFYFHPGVNPVAIIRAIKQNIRSGKVVSGGSTITMQVSRLARNNPERTYLNKLVEIIWASNLEIRFSKTEILRMYASHAPFGSNVVGLEAASWRYFSRRPSDLSWAEAATLAVLPNAPSLVYPGKSSGKLRDKRDKLLTRLLERSVIDSLTWRLATAEPVPGKLQPLPILAYHLTERAAREKPGERIRSTIDYYLQEKVYDLVVQHNNILKSNKINNIAVLVTSVNDKKVLAYIGNVYDGVQQEHNNHVDAAIAPRSTGSILKPFLYSLALDHGQITSRMLIPDIPGKFGGFSPMNFDQNFDGAVSAEEALARSLNIPAVRILKDFGVAPFYDFLKKAGMNHFKNTPDHYGLSLILGGCEASLWELAGMYTSYARILDNYQKYDGKGEENPFAGLLWNNDHEYVPHMGYYQPVIRPSAVYLTLTSLLNVKRPDSEAGWQGFASTRKIAWKTGTSFGFRDGWAVGVTPGYVVSVWTGNADGEGRQGLTGAMAAAPLLFDIFCLLPVTGWFSKPADDLQETAVCLQSGYLPGQYCEEMLKIEIPSGVKIPVCPFHQIVHLDRNEKYRVTDNCYPVSEMSHRNWFILPPVMEFYYRQKHPLYAVLPPLMENCEETAPVMDFIYPREWNRLFLPTDIDGTPGKIIFELAHRQNDACVYWHLDNAYMGETNGFHQFAISAGEGWHTIYAVDNKGNQIKKHFLIVNKNRGEP